MSGSVLEIAHVLFVDIVGYSLLPLDQQRQAVRTLQDAIRASSDYARSRQSDELIVLPTGDGSALVFFRDAEAPVRCALELAGNLSTADFQVRMGVNTGPVYRVADINASRSVAGGGINIAQRVMEAGDAGHILVSGAAAEVLSEVGSWRECLHDLGFARIKHGASLHLFNLYTATAGNPNKPHRFAAAAAGARSEQPVPPPSTRKASDDVGLASSAKIRLLSVDDHPLLREGIATLINSQSDMSIIAEASNGAEAIARFREVRPDVTLMDVRLPDISGIDAMIAIRKEFPDACIIMLTTSEGDVEIQRALGAGARGYILKSMPPKDLIDAVRQVHAGKKRIPASIAAHLAEHYSDESLTAREIEVLQQIAGGNRNRDIAERLFISEETVKVHIKHIMEKLAANDRTQAVAIALKRGIIHL